MAEEIITALSRYRWFFVIARNSSFTYKGRAVDVTQVAKELGVRYVLEGSVRKAGKRVRVTAQLVDATTGNHIWAERYDRELDDIFALQDEITETIVAAVEPELGAVERERAGRRPPESLDAWGLYQRGLWLFYADPSGCSGVPANLTRASPRPTPNWPGPTNPTFTGVYRTIPRRACSKPPRRRRKRSPSIPEMQPAIAPWAGPISSGAPTKGQSRKWKRRSVSTPVSTAAFTVSAWPCCTAAGRKRAFRSSKRPSG
jgi:hypothetical protein